MSCVCDEDGDQVPFNEMRPGNIILLALLCIMLGAVLVVMLGGCTLAGSLGPNITMTGDKGPLDVIQSSKADGSTEVKIDAGEDVGYHLEVWRNKSAPNISSEVKDTEGSR